MINGARKDMHIYILVEDATLDNRLKYDDFPPGSFSKVSVINAQLSSAILHLHDARHFTVLSTSTLSHRS